MAYSEEIKNEVKKRLQKGEKVKALSDEFGISIPTIYKWRNELKTENIKEEQVKDEDVVNIEMNEEEVLKHNAKEFREELKVQQLEQESSEKLEKRDKKNHYKIVIDYLKEKRHDIYAKMQSTDYVIQKEGISQWDKMERKIEKVEQNKDNAEIIEQLYDKIVNLQKAEMEYYNRKKINGEQSR